MNYNIFPLEGKWGFPSIPAVRLADIPQLERLQFFTFKDSKNYYMNGRVKGECGVQFFLDDKYFEAVWNTPEKYIDHLREFGAVCQPDFSLYTNWAIARQMWSHYRNQWVAKYWTAQGIKVIPTVTWSTPESYEWCFDGVPKHSVVALSSVGCWKDETAHRLFVQGYAEMKRQLEPECVLWRGNVPDEFHADRIIKMYENGDLHFRERHTKPHFKRMKVKV